jgi:ribosomal protein S18 acetylase RimI-like enzyme
MKTRKALASDALAIASVQVASWQAAYRHLLPADWLASMSVDDRRIKWEEIIGAGQSDVVVALRDESVVGFASSGECSNKDARPHTHELYALYVHPAVWSRGHGWDLWQCVREAADRQRSEVCTLWAIAGNERGVRFYERVGFSLEQGSRQNFEIAGVSLAEDRYALALRTDDTQPVVDQRGKGFADRGPSGASARGA